MERRAHLGEIRQRIGDNTIRTRFAPSPTGYLHLGHVVNALYVWGIARALGGEVILRLENHDRSRCKPEYEAALLQDLEWLGFVPDYGKPVEFRAGACAYRQSDCDAHYQTALAHLRTVAHVYACDCSRSRIQARTGQPDGEELRYDGHCRDRGLPESPDTTLRVVLPDEIVAFDDILQGPQIQHPCQEVGDLALRDNHGHWTYHFAVVADDIRQDVNLIVRGMDILTSTGRQILLARYLSPDFAPIYAHHALLTDASGRKLSKRDFDADIHTLMLQGEKAANVLGRAAQLAGLGDGAPIHAENVPLLF
jgi:glutamyl/glutaminyl-tRNA synthetase